jgi:DNA polymerase III delta prime subunit
MPWRKSHYVALASGVGLSIAVFAVWLATGNNEVLLALLPVVVQVVLQIWPKPAERPALAPVQTATQAMIKFWSDEAHRRGEGDMDTMPSRWRRSAAAGTVRERVPAEGSFPKLIKTYAAQPFRLLLLGPPGSGKTAFCNELIRELLKTDDPKQIPVLLQLVSWNRQEKFEDWVVDQLHTNHGISRRTARTLVEGRKVLPILDGLDEGFGHPVGETVRRLQASQFTNTPLVITCDENEFDVADAGRLLRRDAEIRILPVSAEEIVEVLEQAADGRPSASWGKAVQQVRAGKPLAEALNTRLMLALMLRVLTQNPESPDRLLQDAESVTAEQLREELVGLVMRDSVNRLTSREFPDARRNRHWLRYLAAKLRNDSDMRLSWWRFFEVLKGSLAFSTVRVLTGALLTAGLCLILFGLFGYPLMGLIFGAVLGGVGGLSLSLPPPADPRALPRVLRSEEGLMPAVISGLVSGIGGAVALGILYEDVLVGLSVGSALGLGFGTGRRLLTSRPVQTARVLGPEEVLSDDRQTMLKGFLLGGLVGGIVGAGLGLVGRAKSLGLVLPITNLPQEALVGAAIGALCGSFTLAMMFQATSAWGRYVLTHFILASRELVPWRLMAFLRAAEQAGILHRHGPQYEFRSELFRAHLASEKD